MKGTGQLWKDPVLVQEDTSLPEGNGKLPDHRSEVMTILFRGHDGEAWIILCESKSSTADLSGSRTKGTVFLPPA